MTEEQTQQADKAPPAKPIKRHTRRRHGIDTDERRTRRNLQDIPVLRHSSTTGSQYKEASNR